MSLFQNLLKSEIGLALWCQERFYKTEWLQKFFTDTFTQSKLFDIFAPLIGILDHRILVELLVTGTLTNFVTIVAKSVIEGDRPYWWVNETPLFQGITRPRLHQTPQTCETSTGMPSGHSLGITTFSYILYKNMLEYARHNNYEHQKRLKVVLQSFFSGLVGFMWLTRIYFGCHFAHQCLVGTALSLFLVNLLDQRKVKNYIYGLSRWKAIGAVCGLLACGGIIYGTKLLLDIDPHHSVRMAFKWCEDPKWLKHESTPIYSFFKYLGKFSGIALSAPLIEKMKSKEQNMKLKLPFTIVTIVGYETLKFWTPKNYGRVAFLSYVFLLNMFHVYTVINIIPKFSEKKKTSTDRLHFE